MAKNDKNRQHETTAAENYYDLKIDAVEKLVNAKDAPKVSDAEIRKYTSKGKFYIPSPVKILFVKFWFGGAICYFFLWGLGIYLQGLDLMIAIAVGLGVAMDLLINHLLHSLEPEAGEYDKWMMVPFRGFWTVFLNVLYAGLILYCIVNTYEIINTLIAGSVETAENVPIGVEPLLFGLLFMGFDMLFITIKNTMVKIFRDAREKASGNK